MRKRFIREEREEPRRVFQKSIQIFGVRFSLLPTAYCLLPAFIFTLLISSLTHAKTGFQDWSAWDAATHLPADVAMVYNADAERLNSWATHGFEPWVMFGASWLGKTEPIVVQHPEIVQTLQDGTPFEMIPGRAWVIPAEPWIEYTNARVTGFISLGALGILPEEPEYFVTNGYGAAFKDAWQKYYNEPWRPPFESAENYWLGNQLKSLLFTEFYRQVFAHAKSLNPGVHCVIPAHSNINYADWGIVTPHFAYSQLPDTDGFIAQAWTGTAKHAHLLGGEPVRDTFAYAFLEYASYVGLVDGTDKELWMLTDPVEDAQGAPWADLTAWYEGTLIAALVHPGNYNYEIVPWPRRVFMTTDLYGGSAIPEAYATELLTVWAAQQKLPAGKIAGDVTNSIAFLTSDTLMWQRKFSPDRFDGFLAPMLAAVRRGIYTRVLPAERLVEPGFPPADVKVIVTGFDAWKPASPAMVEALAAWVKNGGTLVFMGGADAFNNMPGSWWKKAGFDSPADALLKALGINIKRKKTFEDESADKRAMTLAMLRKPVSAAGGAPEALRNFSKIMSPMPLTAYDADGASVLFTQGKVPIIWEAAAGKGQIIYAGIPGEFVAVDKDGPEFFVELLRYSLETYQNQKLIEADAFVVNAQPFVIAQGLSGGRTLPGPFINLLRPADPPVGSVTLADRGYAFLLDINEAQKKCNCKSGILHASGTPKDISVSEDQIQFKLPGPINRLGYVWLSVPRTAAEKTGKAFNPVWFDNGSILRVSVTLSPEGTPVTIQW